MCVFRSGEGFFEGVGLFLLSRFRVGLDGVCINVGGRDGVKGGGVIGVWMDIGGVGMGGEIGVDMGVGGGVKDSFVSCLMVFMVCLCFLGFEVVIFNLLGNLM